MLFLSTVWQSIKEKLHVDSDDDNGGDHANAHEQTQ
jgi:hypothetical protein